MFFVRSCDLSVTPGASRRKIHVSFLGDLSALSLSFVFDIINCFTCSLEFQSLGGGGMNGACVSHYPEDSLLGGHAERLVKISVSLLPRRA